MRLLKNHGRNILRLRLFLLSSSKQITVRKYINNLLKEAFMQLRFNFRAIFLTLILIALIVFSGCSKKSAETQTSGTNERPTLSNAEKAYEILQVQNAYIKHAYCILFPPQYIVYGIM